MSPKQKAVMPQVEEKEMVFPVAGIDLSGPFFRQMPRQMPNGEWGRTCRSGVNVRAYEGNTIRARGGTRPGLSKAFPSPVISGWINQELATLVSTFGVPVEASQSGRVVTLVAVSQGNVYYIQAGGTNWSLATNATGVNPPLNFSGIVYSASLNQKLWFADGINYCYFDASNNTVFRWTASSGTLPVDNRNNTPRLICNWRGRMVLSGLLYDPQNWFMSAQLDPTNWNTNPVPTTPTQAIFGNNSPAGTVGDVITSLVPYSDDVLIFGGDHTLYMCNGDPMAGGQIDLITDAIGMAWGIPWAKDPYGNLYFLSNKTGIYTMVPGQQPQRISQGIEQLLQQYDTGLTTCRMFWNDRFQGLHVFMTNTAAPQVNTHLFWEYRTGAWWQDQFGSTNFDPLTGCTFDGNTAGDRTVLIGSWDGYVRCFQPTNTTDDGTNITSSVVLGPFTTKNLDLLLLKYIQAVLGTASGTVTASVYTGATAEAALSNPNPIVFTWTAGRNLNNFVRSAGHAIYIKLDSTAYWAMEQIRCTLQAQGKVGARGYLN
jgi:hypothetical protein